MISNDVRVFVEDYLNEIELDNDCAILFVLFLIDSCIICSFRLERFMAGNAQFRCFLRLHLLLIKTLPQSSHKL